MTVQMHNEFRLALGIPKRNCCVRKSVVTYAREMSVRDTNLLAFERQTLRTIFGPILYKEG